MKQICITLILSSMAVFAAQAQSITIDPNSLQLPRFSVNPGCGVNDKGKVIFNTTQNKMLYCNGTNWIDPVAGGASSDWITTPGQFPKTTILNNSIGIGTTSPAKTVDIQSTLASLRLKSTSAYSEFKLESVSGANYLQFVKNNNTQWSIRTDNPGGEVNLDFVEAAGGIRMTMEKITGNIGINTSDPAYKLHVNGSVAGVGAYNNTSDGRLKTNIKAIESPLEKVLQLRGITFDWDLTKANGRELDTKNHYGFIAQEIEKIIPQVVSTADDTDQTKSVAYGDVVPILVEAIKEQQKQINRLENRLNSLISAKQGER